MFQKIYSDTLGGRFIKSLLAQTPVPLFTSVVDGDQIVEGCYYVYKRFVIRCVQTGLLNMKGTGDSLFPSPTIYPTVFLVPRAGYRIARFQVTSIVDEDDPRITGVFRSASNYYDSETHYHLGRYIRFLHTKTGLNLFPFYNCFAGSYLSDVILGLRGNNVTIRRTTVEQYKVAAVPIIFGRSYSIHIDCPTQVLMRACIRDDSGFVEEEKLPVEVSSVLRSSGKSLGRMTFRESVKFKLNTVSKQAVDLQRNLYLLIQLPKNNDSSIVVLENVDEGVTDNQETPKLLNLSLLRMNTKTSFAFSDRLIEYLVNNIIGRHDYNSKNIAKVQLALSLIFPEYDALFKNNSLKMGIYDDNIDKYIMQIVEPYTRSNMIYDQDGSVNKDVEQIIYGMGGGKY